MNEKKTAIIDNLENAYSWLKQTPLILWCAEKRMQLEKTTPPPVTGILTAEQAKSQTKTQ